MSATKKQLVIIYCAENLISGKKYVGMTTRPLKVRIADHYYKTAKHYKHKFANALNYYSKESWSWYVLAEVEYEKADEYERFFIADLDTFNNGYNSTAGGSLDGEISPTYNPEICSVYKPEFGVVSGTRSELAKLYPELVMIRRLINRKQKQINGWILAEHKDSYEVISSGKKTPKTIPITLTHEEYGIHTLFPRDFVEKFGLKFPEISKLLKGQRKTHGGWKLTEEK